MLNRRGPRKRDFVVWRVPLGARIVVPGAAWWFSGVAANWIPRPSRLLHRCSHGTVRRGRGAGSCRSRGSARADRSGCLPPATDDCAATRGVPPGRSRPTRRARTRPGSTWRSPDTPASPNIRGTRLWPGLAALPAPGVEVHLRMLPTQRVAIPRSGQRTQDASARRVSDDVRRTGNHAAHDTRLCATASR